MDTDKKYARYVADIRSVLGETTGAIDFDRDLVQIGFRGGWKAAELSEALMHLENADKAATSWEGFIVPVRHLASMPAISLLSIRFQQEMARKGVYWHNTVRDECCSRFECCAHIWEERGYGHVRDALIEAVDTNRPFVEVSKSK